MCQNPHRLPKRPRRDRTSRTKETISNPLCYCSTRKSASGRALHRPAPFSHPHAFFCDPLKHPDVPSLVFRCWVLYTKYIGSKFRDSFSFYYVCMFEGVVSSGPKKNKKVTGERRCESVWSSPQPELALGRKERDLSNHRDVGEGCLMSRLVFLHYHSSWIWEFGTYVISALVAIGYGGGRARDGYREGMDGMDWKPWTDRGPRSSLPYSCCFSLSVESTVSILITTARYAGTLYRIRPCNCSVFPQNPRYLCVCDQRKTRF